MRHSYLAKKRLISGLVGFDVKDVASGMLLQLLKFCLGFSFGGLRA